MHRGRKGGGRGERRHYGQHGSSRDESPGGSRGRGRGRHPPGLRGRDIGLYYARMNKKPQEEQHFDLKVNLDDCRKNEIVKLLQSSSIKEEADDAKRMSARSQDEGSETYSHIADSMFKRSFLRNLEGNQMAECGAPSRKGRDGLDRNQVIDEALHKEFLETQKHNEEYKKMQPLRMRLPSYDKREQIIDVLKQNQVMVISGETGCGKTTQVAQFILDDALENKNGSVCRIVCTQPRRISAISVAQRVADERGEKLEPGGSVGYQIRLECEKPRERGSILFCTTGILIQWLQFDPNLSKVSHLIVDEIHERDVLSDFVLTIMKDLLPLRPDMKLILMSATLNAERFSKYYNNCPFLNIPGFTFPVTEYYLEDVLEKTGFELDVQHKNSKEPKWKQHLSYMKTRLKERQDYEEFMGPYIRHLQREGKYSRKVLDALAQPESENINLDLIVALVHHICATQPDGAILVFLPGWDQISKLHNMLTDSRVFSTIRSLIYPLHSSMPTVNQKEIFKRPSPGIRKIIIATNIAETSITIDDVVYVVDCGKIKMKNFDVERNIQTLQPEWVSLANAKQRRGRAGRVQPGICYHLYSKRREMLLESYPLPEMLRSRLEEVILQLKILQLGLVRPFLTRVLDPPNPLAIDYSLKLLSTLNALDDQERLTPLGFHLAQLPVDPQTGKMLLMGALFQCLDPVLSVAASLSFKDAFMMPLGSEEKVNERKLELSCGLKSDHLVLSEAIRRWELAEQRRRGKEFAWDYFLSSSTLTMLRNMKNQFSDHLAEKNFLSSRDPKSKASNLNSQNASLVKAVICAGLYPNIAVIRKVACNRKTGRISIKLSTQEDGKVELHPKSVNARQRFFESPLLLYHLKLKSTAVFLHDTTMVHPLPLLFFGGRLQMCESEENGCTILKMDGMRFQCKKDTAQLIMMLRSKLDKLLEYKITHPDMTNWEPESREGALLRAITELITTEDEQLSLDSQDSD